MRAARCLSPNKVSSRKTCIDKDPPGTGKTGCMPAPKKRAQRGMQAVALLLSWLLPLLPPPLRRLPSSQLAAPA
jgi:hypothetical protein